MTPEHIVHFGVLGGATCRLDLQEQLDDSELVRLRLVVTEQEAISFKDGRLVSSPG